MSDDFAKKESARNRKIIIVSNRLPVQLSTVKGRQQFKRSGGGLVTAVEPVQAKHKLLWIGAIGGSAIAHNRAKQIFEELRKKYSYLPIFLSRSEWQSYYVGFSNRALWPLFHYFPHHCYFDDKQWQSYQKVNEVFARNILKIARPEDLIWIHDFHLLLVPQLIRARMPEARIGFFLHTPFPSSEIFRILPWRKEILEGLLGADLIAFHTYDFVRHFRSSTLRILGVESGMTKISYEGRDVALAAIPVGADADKIQKASVKARTKGGASREKKDKLRIKIILCVDRLDYTKGVLTRLRAYQQFLTRYPRWRGKVELHQVLVPSRTEITAYTLLKQKIDELSGRINAQFSRADWVPARCFYRNIDFEQLLGLYRRADVAAVTPLRDGMNLVAKEFLLAQDESDPGVLILSEFCGAASELSEAIIVNPWNASGLVEAFDRALEMSKEEALRRYQAMVGLLKRYSAENWGVRFIGELESVTGLRRSLLPVLNVNAQNELKKAWHRARARLIYLDYDGTLTDLVGLPDKAVPTKEIQKLVSRLSADEKNTVMIVSGRPKELLLKWFGESACYLCAEHGAWIWDLAHWHRTYKANSHNWKDKILPIMELYTTRTPGSLIEEKEDAVAWHYRLCEPEFGSSQARDLAINLEELIKGTPLRYILGKKVVEVKHGEVKKSLAWEWMRTSKRAFDYILAFGDDRTDEDLFRVLPENAWSIHIGTHDSSARFRLDSPAQVRSLLESLAQHKHAR